MPIKYCKECLALHNPKDMKENCMCFHYWMEHIRPTIDKLYRKNLIQYKQRKKRIRVANDV